MTTTLIDTRETAVKEARAIAEGAKAAGRELTPEEVALVNEKLDAVKGYDEQIANAKAAADLTARLGALPTGEKEQASDEAPVKAKSLGEHFAKSVGAEGFVNLKNVGGFTVSAPAFKAATDPQTVPAAFSPVLTEVDTSIVRSYRRASVADLMGSGSLSGNAITYFVEGAVEGAFTTVAEGGQKPQLHIADPTAVTDALKKIAAWFDSSDEMAEDVPFWVSEINNRGLYLLEMIEEAQLVSGDGTGSNIKGALNRTGVQTETQAATGDSAQDAIFRALTKVQTATGLTADGIIINPADYQALRLSKDSNGQYFGGGFFSGEYGNGGVTFQPPLWGVNTVVSAAVPAKTVAVGAFKAATTVYRKGGVRVESTNSDLGKFTKNVITTRIEERIALAVRIPSAIVKVTLV